MKIEFNTGNSAFDEYGNVEICRILEEIGSKIQCGYDHGVIMDINGNKIGYWNM